MLISLHVFCAFLSLGLLIIRGIMQLRGKDWRAIKLLKILPHLADTLLIVSGLTIFSYCLLN
ncbi:invasion gene expression up-regulator, SirB [Rodentibacter pneumotropicus]|uniref:Invasion gene expression up-regulator, SirB n=1 Tax=Rodentibacter pneumotropicus TaxID=758 RepID=A0A3S4TZV8_9PAST|nr:invasion gene expression up-regulator, SirB [Rodentibacter pneumotropicus]